MAYSVNQLAKLSGVTIRTLHFYDEIGLLAPAYHAANGYRFYEETQVHILVFVQVPLRMQQDP